jgi:riboflavin kinase/FMN adenylyltransferase
MFVCSDPAALAVRPRAVALGTFDGVHLGHRALLDRARATGLTPTVVTFDPHPRIVLGRGVALIAPLSRRLELLELAGITDTVVVPFTREVAAMAPEEWAEQVLRPIGTRRVVVGEGFRFGARAAGDAATLRGLGFVVDEVGLTGGASSTRVRQLVAAGALTAAGRLLGRPVEIEGAASPDGWRRLRLLPDSGMSLPPSGTYAGRARGLPVLDVVVDDGQVELRSARPLPHDPPPRIRVRLPRDAIGPAGIGARTQTFDPPRMAS